ncbi:UNKNOWN [Stylonychia lemnae]|uniref:Uncharacterized protein n=1 Tax=Stylonychia lemnae TaxID=5949 RepID=A0A078AWX4_STYLE|nr:UNKNOWN [Stylonychia lemnae]|eukprot:CDW86935.1 UNKNOWN [Stylonychia lemnae]
MRDEVDRLESKLEDNQNDEQGSLVDIKNKIREMALEQTLIKQIVQSRDSVQLKTTILDEIMKSNTEALTQQYNLVDATRPASLVNRVVLLETKIADMQRKMSRVSFADQMPLANLSTDASLKSVNFDQWMDMGNLLSSDELKGTNSGLQKQFIGQLQKTIEEMDKIIRIKFNEQKIRVEHELNSHAQLTLKMMEEFRLRMSDLEIQQADWNNKINELSKLYSDINQQVALSKLTTSKQLQSPNSSLRLPLSQKSNREQFDIRDPPQKSGSFDNSGIERLRSDFDNFVIYVQKFIEEHLNVLARIVRAEYKTIEDKMDTIEWAVRNADFISNDEIQKFFLVFRELYASPDPQLRNSYIQANHLNDSILTVIDVLDKEFSKLEFQFTNKDLRMGTEKKTIVVWLLNLIY